MKEGNFKHREKLFDLTIVVYSIITTYYFGVEKLFKNIKTVPFVLLFLSVYMTIYLSSVYYRIYKRSNNEKLRKAAYFIMLQVLFVTALIMPIPFKAISENKSSGSGFWDIARLLVMGLNIVVIIFIFEAQEDALSGREEAKENEKTQLKEGLQITEKSSDDYLDTPIGSVMMILGVILWVLSIYYYFTHFRALFAIPLTLLTASLIPVMAVAGGYLTTLKGYLNYIEPVFFGMVYSLWVDFIFYSYIANNGSVKVKLIILFFTGVFSLRIFIFMEPPVNKIHIITGLVSLLYFLYNLGIFGYLY